MYQPSHFAQHEPAALQALMREHPLAVLVTQQDGLPTADHIPLEFDPASNALRGHVARANPLWRAAQGQPVLAVFTGPQAYVSPSWYPSKAATHKVVPTWNYTVVHAQGVLRAVDDAPWLHALVSRLTAHHERPQAPPWAVADAPDGIARAGPTRVGKGKLRHTRSAADRAGVVAGLQQGDAQARATAALMQDAAPPAS